MNKKINDQQLIIASHNKGKVKEISDLLSGYSLRVSSSEDYGMVEPEENGSSFEENALIKALETSRYCGLVALSDDSGLCVNALGSEPGIYSARWAGPKKDFLKAAKDIEKKLTDLGSSDYSAYFICALAICWPDGKNKVFEGRIDGTLTFPPRGKLGFGYDPIFIPEGHDKTFAEMDPTYKHKISHRSKAFELFSKELLVEK